MVSATGKGGRYRYYSCSKSLKEGVEACSGHRVRIDEFERQAVKQIVELAFSVENIKRLLKDVRQALRDKERPIKEIRLQLEDIESRLKRYYDAFESGKMEPEFCGKRVDTLEIQKKQLELELERRRAPKELPPHLGRKDNILKIQESMRQLFTQSKPTVVKRLLRTLVKEIVINGDDVTLIGHATGLMAMVETGSKRKSTPEVTEVLNSCYKWQPVGDSNPCNGTENPVAMENKGRNTNDLLGDFSQGTPEGTQADAKTSQIDTIRAALAGLSREDLIALLADALKGKEAGREMS